MVRGTICIPRINFIPIFGRKLRSPVRNKKTPRNIAATTKKWPEKIFKDKNSIGPRIWDVSNPRAVKRPPKKRNILYLTFPELFEGFE